MSSLCLISNCCLFKRQNKRTYGLAVGLFIHCWYKVTACPTQSGFSKWQAASTPIPRAILKTANIMRNKFKACGHYCIIRCPLHYLFYPYTSCTVYKLKCELKNMPKLQFPFRYNSSSSPQKKGLLKKHTFGVFFSFLQIFKLIKGVQFSRIIVFCNS